MNARYDIDIYQGQDFSISVTAKDSEGNLIDLTDYTLTACIKEKYTSTGSLMPFYSEILSPANSGAFRVSLSSDDTSALPASQIIYEVKGEKSGIYQQFLMGYANVHPSICS